VLTAAEAVNAGRLDDVLGAHRWKTEVVTMLRVWVFSLMLMFGVPVQALPQWAAMPAFDPMHVEGPYAGRVVCPMCTHGYDAGLLVFVPADVAPATAARIAATLRAAALPAGDTRFRVFVIVTGAAAGPGLRAALKHDAENWHVAELQGEALAAAERDYRTALTDRVFAHAFAQRRMVRALDAVALQDEAAIRRAADDAMSLLALAQDGPDDRRGSLWLAANELPRTLRTGAGPRRRLCLSDADDRPMMHALVMLRPAPAERAGAGHSAQADDQGCVGLHGDAAATLAVFAPDAANFVARVDPAQSADDRPLRVQPARERIVGRPCDGCEHVFVGRPRVVETRARIAPLAAPGPSLRIDGRVVDATGRPVPGILIYAHQTDADGRYPDRGDGHPHGRLRAWVRSDAQGRYRFDTIRPGAYPGRTDPAHVHLQVLEPDRCTYYIDDLTFSDDPRNPAPTATERAAARGGSGYVVPTRGADGQWFATRDIVLGRRISGYDACASPRDRARR
jgi:protocatechuate 3,4-dioxygenase beta subunit